jgi:hypothetical protein
MAFPLAGRTVHRLRASLAQNAELDLARNPDAQFGSQIHKN